MQVVDTRSVRGPLGFHRSTLRFREYVCPRRHTISVAFCFLLTPLTCMGQANVVTYQYDNARSGQNTSETILTTTNVKVNQFGKLFAQPVDGEVYAQPLYLTNVAISGKGTHNVVIVATENDSVYAFDADSNAGANSVPLWHASLVDTAHGANPGETAVDDSTTLGCGEPGPKIGITSTPVIDQSTGTIYVEAKSTNGSNYYHRLHALDIVTGNEKSPGPVQIKATVSGTGDGSSNGSLTFESMALHQNNRPALLLMNGTIFIGYGSHCDFSPFHGWLFAYDEATLAQKGVFVSTPNTGMGGIWMSGAGPAADTSGNLYLATGNGTFSQGTPLELGDSILKFHFSNGILSLSDYFTPFDQANDAANDIDVGSGGVLLLPDQPGAHPHVLVQAAKAGRIYVIDRDQMTTNNSHYCRSCNGDPEILEESAAGAINPMFSMAAYWNSTIYVWAEGDVLKSIPITNGLPDFAHITSILTGLGFPGATPSISSNGSTAGTAILWAIDSSQYGPPAPGPGPSVLHAYDATNISNELWNSSQAPNSRDRAGNAVRFTVPRIANGKVYIGTDTEVDVYGLLTGGLPPAATPVIGPTPGVYTNSVTVSITDSTPGATITYTTDGSTPVPGSHGTPISSGGSFTLTSSATVNAIASASGFANSQMASATYTIQASSPPINFGTGFSGETTLTLNGGATINGTRLRLTDGGSGEARSAFFNTQVNVQSFTNDFSFQLTNPSADGFTFTIQGNAANVVGPNGGGLGYGPGTPGGTPPVGMTPIGKSLAIKFDLYNNAGEGTDSTGWYTNGASPTTPASDMTASGVNLHSGDAMNVHMTYNGTTLTWTITDSTAGTSFTTSATVNIPSMVGGNSAFVGFTAGTGGATATQEIITWTYAPQAISPAATPVIGPTPGVYTNSVTVSITDSTPGATITYTTDGSTPVPGSHGTPISSGGSFTLTSSATVNAIASASGFANSQMASATYTIQASSPPINFGTGFSGETTLTLNGGATINGTRLRLTDGGSGEARSAFFNTQVNVQSFTNDFSFQLTNPSADGFTFTIQGNAANVVGPNGGGLGYGPGTPGGTPPVGMTPIGKSLAIKFDLYNNAGEGTDSTGWYTNGASPTTPASDMTASGVNLHSGDAMNVHMTYNGTTLTWTITDSTAGTSFTTSATVNIPSMVGGNSAFVGFTAGTGGATATQEIITWTYAPQAISPAATPVMGRRPGCTQTR